MQNRSRAGLAQLTMVGTIGICLGLIAGFMFMSVVDTVSLTLTILQSIKLISQAAPLFQVLERRAGPQVQDKQLPGSTASLTGMCQNLGWPLQRFLVTLQSFLLSFPAIRPEQLASVPARTLRFVGRTVKHDQPKILPALKPVSHRKTFDLGCQCCAEDQADATSEKLTAKADSNVLPVALTDSSMGTASASKGRSIHTLCTSNGSPYLNYQTRIM